MLKLRATWNIPGAATPTEPDAEFSGVHVPLVRTLPGIRRHTVLTFLRDTAGGHPAWWRGEELYFDDVAELDAAAATGTWTQLWQGRFTSLVAGLRRHVFDIVEEFEPAGRGAPAPGSTPTALSGIWQVPARLTPADVEDVYLNVHVPGVRRLPRLRRHTVMRAVDWPAGVHAQAWRSAEIRFDSAEDFEATFGSEDYAPIRRDGFTASVAGPDVDIYRIDEEWTPAT
ncbi:hypothetical protein ABZ863_13695 [Saccharomonospora sp. NPDC046836]|uniref:hypothetical protein n=1 Tax=Saccharomonospora sp. NPDC046836 TaxID=3156921 RepID=UPI0033FB5D41